MKAPDAIEAIVSLMATDYESVGFLTRQAVTEACEEAGAILAWGEADRLDGYLLHGPVHPCRPMRVKQLLVAKDHQGNGVGKRLWAELVDRARQGRASRIRLRCAATLAANGFWLAMGCNPIHTSHPTNTRNRAIVVYEYPLAADLFTVPDEVAEKVEEQLVHLERRG